MAPASTERRSRLRKVEEVVAAARVQGTTNDEWLFILIAGELDWESGGTHRCPTTPFVAIGFVFTNQVFLKNAFQQGGRKRVNLIK